MHTCGWAPLGWKTLEPRPHLYLWGRLVICPITIAPLEAQMIENLPAMQQSLVWSLGREEPLEKAMATHCSILAWRIPWTDHGVAKSGTRVVSN